MLLLLLLLIADDCLFVWTGLDPSIPIAKHFILSPKPPNTTTAASCWTRGLCRQIPSKTEAALITI